MHCSMPGLASAVAIDNRWLSQLAALLNILRTLFICLAIYAGTVIFNHDASRLVLQPIQRMLKQVMLTIMHGQGLSSLLLVFKMTRLQSQLAELGTSLAKVYNFGPGAAVQECQALVALLMHDSGLTLHLF